MVNLKELCEKFFGTSDLYKVLEVQKECKDSDVKKAYYKKSLKVHPDRVGKDEQADATEKFQVLGKVYSVLSDAEKRKAYDETGSVDEEEFSKGDINWDEYWRLLFKKITEDDIKKFEKEYKGSEEETSDIQKHYVEFEGDMDKIMGSVMCSTIEDEPRIREVIEKLIGEDKVPAFEAFTQEPEKKKAARQRKAEKEAKEAEKLAKDLGFDAEAKEGDDDKLRALIARRGKERAETADKFLDSLAEKYGGGRPKRKAAENKKVEPLYSDEESEEVDSEEETKKKKKKKRGSPKKTPRGRGRGRGKAKN